MWDTEAFLYVFEVETPQIISRAAHALPDGKCFSLANPPGLLYEPVLGPMLCSQRRCQRSSSSPRAGARAHALQAGIKCQNEALNLISRDEFARDSPLQRRVSCEPDFLPGAGQTDGPDASA